MTDFKDPLHELAHEHEEKRAPKVPGMSLAPDDNEVLALHALLVTVHNDALDEASHSLQEGKPAFDHLKYPPP